VSGPLAFTNEFNHRGEAPESILRNAIDIQTEWMSSLNWDRI